MPIVEGLEADSHKYIIEGVIDHEVVERQSRVAAEKYGTSSVVHYHPHGVPCVNREGNSPKHEPYGEVRIHYGTIKPQLLTLVNKPIA